MAATVTADLFRQRFPEFEEIADDVVVLRLSEARALHNVTVPGTLYALAHLLATEAERTGAADGGAGVVVSESIGPRTVNYLTEVGGGGSQPGSGGDRRAFFATSVYGRRLLALEERTPRLIATARAIG